MRNVRNVAILGAGRVGTNIAAYLRILGASPRLVTHAEARTDRAMVADRLASSDVVAIATPDTAIARAIDDWRDALEGKRVIHFSGALTIPGALGYHPLYSFPPHALPPDALRRIPFAVEEGAPPLAEVLPGAGNPTFVVKASDKAFYHAIAVLTGNFAAHIWNEAAAALPGRLPGLPPAALGPYLESVVERYCERPEASATGPVARRDPASVEANLRSLAAEPRLRRLYEAFLASAWPNRSPDSSTGGER